MRQDFRRKPHRYTFHPLEKQQGELYRQGHRLLFTPVVGWHPVSDFGIIKGIKGERRQPCLDISSGSGVITRQDVAPVTLRLYQQLLLPQLHQCILYRGIAMRVILHGVAYYIGNLVETPVIKRFHRMKYAALHRLQAIVDMWHGTLQDNI